MTMLRRTLFESFLISVVIGAVLLFVPRPEAEAQQGGPTVTVTTGTPSPSAGLPGTKFTTSLGASVNGEPEIGDECELEGPTWSWSVTSVERGDTASGPWTAMTGENVWIEHTNPNSASAKLFAIFSGAGYWRVTVSATAAWSSPDCEAPPPVTGSKSVMMQVVTLQLQEVTFSGSGYQALYSNSADTYEEEGGTQQTGAHFVLQPFKSLPVCYVWKSSPKVTAKFNVVPPLSSGSFSAKFKATGTTSKNNNPLNYLKTQSVSGSSVTVTFTSDDNLMKRVERSFLTVAFEVSGDQGATYGSCGNSVSELLVVVGNARKPQSENAVVGPNRPTMKRMRWIVEQADGATTEKDALDKLWNTKIGTNFSAAGVVRHTTPIWVFVDPVNGGAPALECRGQAILMAAAVAMLGVNPLGQVVYVYPLESTRRNGEVIRKQASERALENPVRRFVIKGNRVVAPHRSVVEAHLLHGANPLNSPRFSETLGYLSGTPAKPTWNHYEACFKFQGVYYAGGVVNETFRSEYEVMEKVAFASYWGFWWQGVVDGVALTQMEPCQDPGPDPEAEW